MSPHRWVRYGHPMVRPDAAWRFISGHDECPMTDPGWKFVGVLELTPLPSIGGIGDDCWVLWVRAADVLLDTLDDTVWVGLSACSMVLTPRIGGDFVEWEPPEGGDETLAGTARRWAAKLPNTAHVIDEQTAICVVDGVV